MHHIAPNHIMLNDVQVTVSWEPSSPVGLTEVVLEPDPGLDHAAVVGLLAQAIERLTIYRASYLEAMAQDRPATRVAV